MKPTPARRAERRLQKSTPVDRSAAPRHTVVRRARLPQPAGASDAPRAWVVTADMGLGHQRAAWPLRDVAKAGHHDAGQGQQHLPLGAQALGAAAQELRVPLPDQELAPHRRHRLRHAGQAAEHPALLSGPRHVKPFLPGHVAQAPHHQRDVLGDDGDRSTRTRFPSSQRSTLPPSPRTWQAIRPPIA